VDDGIYAEADVGALEIGDWTVEEAAPTDGDEEGAPYEIDCDTGEPLDGETLEPETAVEV